MKLLGDQIETALEKVGITSESVSKWLGMSCGCKKRQLKLNQLHVWASRVINGKIEQAKEYLDHILSQ